jgi:hypothetical protein
MMYDTVDVGALCAGSGISKTIEEVKLYDTVHALTTECSLQPAQLLTPDTCIPMLRCFGAVRKSLKKGRKDARF